MKMRDELQLTYHDSDFIDLYSYTGQPAKSPAFLALVSVMEFVLNNHSHLLNKWLTTSGDHHDQFVIVTRQVHFWFAVNGSYQSEAVKPI